MATTNKKYLGMSLGKFLAEMVKAGMDVDICLVPNQAGKGCIRILREVK
jgi:hypothetical protein